MSPVRKIGLVPAGGSVACTLRMGDQQFCVDAHAICEVMGAIKLQQVSLTPDYVAGIFSYRGEVLVAVGLQALPGERLSQQGSVLVLGAADMSAAGGLFGLLVDEVDRVIEVSAELVTRDVTEADWESSGLCCGRVCVDDRWMGMLDARRLHPSRQAIGGCGTIPHRLPG